MEFWSRDFQLRKESISTCYFFDFELLNFMSRFYWSWFLTTCVPFLDESEWTAVLIVSWTCSHAKKKKQGPRSGFSLNNRLNVFIFISNPCIPEIYGTSHKFFLYIFFFKIDACHYLLPIYGWDREGQIYLFTYFCVRQEQREWHKPTPGKWWLFHF